MFGSVVNVVFISVPIQIQTCTFIPIHKKAVRMRLAMCLLVRYYWVIKYGIMWQVYGMGMSIFAGCISTDFQLWNGHTHQALSIVSHVSGSDG
jgi:hypothetical protein